MWSPSGMLDPAVQQIATTDGVNTETLASASFGTDTAWVANLGLWVPFSIAQPVEVDRYFVRNGTLTTAHNIAFGVYREDFTKITSQDFTGTTTASAIVHYNVTNFTLAPGSYFMMMADDSTRNFSCSNSAAALNQAQGIFEMTGLTLNALPDPATPVATTRAFIPAFGLNLTSVIF